MLLDVTEEELACEVYEEEYDVTVKPENVSRNVLYVLLYYPSGPSLIP